MSKSVNKAVVSEEQQEAVRSALDNPIVVEFVNWLMTAERDFYIQDGHDTSVIYQADIENFLNLKYPTVQKENA